MASSKIPGWNLHLRTSACSIADKYATGGLEGVSGSTTFHAIPYCAYGWKSLLDSASGLFVHRQAHNRDHDRGRSGERNSRAKDCGVSVARRLRGGRTRTCLIGQTSLSSHGLYEARRTSAHAPTGTVYSLSPHSGGRTGLRHSSPRLNPRDSKLPHGWHRNRSQQRPPREDLLAVTVKRGPRRGLAARGVKPVLVSLWFSGGRSALRPMSLAAVALRRRFSLA